MRLPITSGASCLGSQLVAAYLPQGREIPAIDSFAIIERTRANSETIGCCMLQRGGFMPELRATSG